MQVASRKIRVYAWHNDIHVCPCPVVRFPDVVVTCIGGPDQQPRGRTPHASWSFPKFLGLRLT
jgi:hypothetical protein